MNKNLPAFHRYLKLRKRMMGVDQLHYYDLYAPLVGSVDLKYTPEEAQKHVLAAVAPLGADYQATIKRAFDNRWIDLFPNEGKRSGAYSNGGAYDVHPYMLINYNGQYADVSTLAHELGHTMQSYFSNKTQPYPLASYPIFVAEVASTFNESLLIDYMLKNIKDDDTRLSLLGNYLENIKGTVFRQTQFAEFELRMHEMAGKGQPITGDALAKLYMDITKRYYGHDQGICIVDDYISHEWSYIPHFYRDFYVFQYATSFTASEALAQKVKAGKRRRDEEVSGVSLGRRFEVSDRSAEGRRRRHDDRRAARSDDEGNEPRDGRNGSRSSARRKRPFADRSLVTKSSFRQRTVMAATRRRLGRLTAWRRSVAAAVRHNATVRRRRQAPRNATNSTARAAPPRRQPHASAPAFVRRSAARFHSKRRHIRRRDCGDRMGCVVLRSNRRSRVAFAQDPRAVQTPRRRVGIVTRARDARSSSAAALRAHGHAAVAKPAPGGSRGRNPDSIARQAHCQRPSAGKLP